jgi:hypothetical protein
VTLLEAMDRAYQTNEATLANQIAAPRLDCDAERLQHYTEFCKQHGVRALGAAPGTVAAFIKSEHDRGVSPDGILSVLADIEALHSNNNLANPIATTAVRAVLSEIVNLNPPRSWGKQERLLFASLPPDVQFIVERHARLDSQAVRKSQNEAAQLRHQLESLQQKEISNGSSD